jgi:predicted CoA-substrate-specific enzyme activase
MTITMGCDVGSLTSKAILMQNGRVIDHAIIASTPKPEVSGQRVIDELLKKRKLKQKDIAFTVGTGYGREKIPMVDLVVPEITCHAKGANWILPSVKTIIDIGGQDCKAIRLDKDGEVQKFVANDKCASGTGRFLEVMADLLHVSVDELGKLSEESTKTFSMAATCTLWAQSEVVKRINSGYEIADIAAGINNAMAARAAIMVNAVGAQDDIMMTGGVAKNRGVLKDLENMLGKRIKRNRKADPQMAGAIGAALIAKQQVMDKKGGGK